MTANIQEGTKSQEFLGHASDKSNSKTTEIYTHVCEKDIQRIHSPMDDFMNATTMDFTETGSAIPPQRDTFRNKFR